MIEDGGGNLVRWQDRLAGGMRLDTDTISVVEHYVGGGRGGGEVGAKYCNEPGLQVERYYKKC